MNTIQSTRLVDDYLRRLEAAAAHLQRSRRAELVAEIREHIEAALRQEEAAGEAAVRNVLERLGPPEEIVDAAEPQPEPSPRRAGRLELVALLALLVPVLGWVVGPVLVSVSPAWAKRDKLIAFALLLLALLLPAIGITAESGGVDQSPVSVADEQPVDFQPEEESTDVGLLLLVTGLAMLAGLPSALYLGWRLRRHPRLEA